MNNSQLTSARIVTGIFILVAVFIAGRYSATDTTDTPQNLKVADSAPTLQEKPILDLSPQTHDDVEAIEEANPSYAELSTSSETLQLNSAQAVESLREKMIEWAKADPHAALVFANGQIEPQFESQQAIIAILHQWASTDPAQAWNWTWENSPNNVARLITEIAKVDPQMAWDNAGLFAEQNPKHPQLGYSSAIDGMLHSGQHALLLDLIEEADIPDRYEGRRDNDYAFIEQIVGDWVLYSPEEAVVWVESLPDDTEDANRKSNAQSALLATWSTTDPIPALEYAKKLPREGGEVEAILQMGLETLFNKDMNLAQQWLNKQDLSPEFDWPIVTMVTKPSLLSQDVHNAIAWAKTITNPDLRDEAFTGIAAYWLVSEPQIAAVYFKENQLLSEEGLGLAQRNAHREIIRMNTVPTYNGLN